VWAAYLVGILAKIEKTLKGYAKMMGNKKTEDLHSGEAYILWAQLVAHYDTLELIDFFSSVAKDDDFKTLVGTAVSKVIKPQINKLESIMNSYRLPLPSRPPSGVNLQNNVEAARDESMFNIISDLSQTAVNLHVKAINMCVNDSIRNMFMNFLNDELRAYDNLVKYGKAKGWIRNAPSYYH
jgi:hypothetical protein